MSGPSVTERQKRKVPCPKCNAGSGKPCRSSRIPGPNTFGGGWGGPPDLDMAHRERRAAYLAHVADRDAIIAGDEGGDATEHRMYDREGRPIVVMVPK